MSRNCFRIFFAIIIVLLLSGRIIHAQSGYKAVWKNIYPTSLNEYYLGSYGSGLSTYIATQDLVLGKYSDIKYRAWVMFPFQALNLDGFQVFSYAFLVVNVTNAGASNSLVDLRRWSYGLTPKQLVEGSYLSSILYDQLAYGNVYSAGSTIFRSTGQQSQSLGSAAITELNDAASSVNPWFIVSMTELDDNSDPHIQLAPQSTYLKVAFIDYSEPSAIASITEGQPDIDISESGNYTVYFSGSTDMQSGIEYYVVKEYFNGNKINEKQILSTAQLNWIRSNQVEGDYVYSVRAFNGSGVGSAEVFSDGVTVQFPPPPPSVELLYGGGHSPASGIPSTSFTFYVYYKSSTGLPPNSNSIKLNLVNGSTVTLTGGGNYQTGVSYQGSVSNLAIGSHEYYFTGQVGNKVLRYPQGTQNLTVSVSEPMQGWDLQVQEVTSTPSGVTPGSSFTGKAKIYNASNSPDKIYYNVPYEFKFYNSSGTLIDSKSGTIPSVSQYQTLYISENFTAPSNEGTCSIVFSANVTRDEHPENNTASKPIVVSSSGPKYKWFIPSGHHWVQMDTQNPTHSFNDIIYTILYGGNTKVTLKRSTSTTNYDIDKKKLRMFDSQSIIVVNEWCTSTPPTGMISFGSSNNSVATYDLTNISAFSGETVEFVVNSNHISFNPTEPDIYFNDQGQTVDPWFDNFSTQNGGYTLKLRFDIPNSATPGTYSFYCGTEFSDYQSKFVAQLKITVLAPPPTITAISKTSLSADDEITITGSNFGSSAGSVSFNTLSAASIVSWSATSVRCIVPVGVQSGTLFVTAPGGPSNAMNYSVISSTGIPQVVQAIPDFSIKTNENRFVADLRQIFSDPNGGNLTFAFASVQNAIVANADSLLNGRLIVSVSSVNQASDRIIVTAKDPSNKSISDTVDVTINLVDPPISSSCYALNFNPGKLFLSWSDNNSIEDGYKIERKSGSSSWTQIAQVGPNVITYLDSNLNSSTIYFYRIRAFKGQFNSSYGPEVFDTTLVPIPPVPSGVNSQVISAYSIRVNWSDNSQLELGFRLERKLGTGAEWVEIGQLSAGTTTFLDTGLTPNRSYSYRVRAFNNTGVSGYSSPTTSQTPEILPLPPMNLSAISDPQSNSVIQLTWHDMSNNETGFKVERSLDSVANWVQISQPLMSTYRDSGLVSGTKYYYRVRAYNSVGNSPFSNIASATTPEVLPNQPDSLIAQTLNSSSIQIRWADRSHNELGFKLERKLSTAPNWLEIVSLPANVKTYNDTGLVQNTTYNYRIRSYNSIGYSGYSNIANATTNDMAPIPPSALATTALGPTKIKLQWNDNSGNETRFTIERSYLRNGPWTKIDSVNMNVTQYSDSNLVPATKYFYRIRAFNSIGYSSYSNIDSAITHDIPPIAPTALVTQAVGSGKVALQWADNSGNESYFNIERSTGNIWNWQIIDSVGANQTQYLDSNLTPVTLYFYRIRAKNPMGYSGYSNIDSALTFDVPPMPPTNLQLAAVTNRIVALSWQDNSSNEVGFKILRKIGFEATWSLLDSTGADITNYTDSLSTTSICWYRIYAFNLFGESSLSDSVSLDLTGMDKESLLSSIPDEFNLYQNYPNPFNPTTIVRFAIPKESIVKIELFSSQGELVNVLESSERKPGYYEVDLNMSNLASGIYLYRITAIPMDSSDPYIQTKKFVLMK